MRVLLQSDRECTIDGVGLLVPNIPTSVESDAFEVVHGYTPAQANFPYFITVTYDLSADEEVNDG
jgi:hypothetical protein